MNTFLNSIDHLVYGTPDLNGTVAHLEKLMGIRATPGGTHPGRGTRNWLMALGSRSYLEILGPDPDQPDPSSPRWMGIDDLQEAALVRWCVARPDLQALLTDSSEALVGQLIPGERKQTDGQLLSWRLTNPAVKAGDGLVPFFIDWGDSHHPAASAAPGARLLGLRATHPKPDSIRSALQSLDVELEVERGSAIRITATLDTPRGIVELG